jgi:hypothetical protein
MAKAVHCSITRRAVVAGSAAALAAPLPGRMVAPARGEAAPDPIHAAIAAHARVYAAYAAQLKAEPEDELAREPLIDAERAAAEAFAATVPTTLQGIAAALGHVCLLHARDNYPLLDDYGCYVLIASADTALRRALAGTASAGPLTRLALR